MEGQIKEEEVVWVKLRGYPWWPAVVKYNINIIYIDRINITKEI